MSRRNNESNLIFAHLLTMHQKVHILFVTNRIIHPKLDKTLPISFSTDKMKVLRKQKSPYKLGIIKVNLLSYIFFFRRT